MKFLLKTVETYRVDTEEEATQLIEEAKKKFTVSKAISEKKSRKAKGEIIDEWVRVTITKEFTEEKEPDDVVSVSYKSEGYFPQPSQEVEDVNSED
jgi:hypothetical protein